MAKLPATTDPTLSAADDALVATQDRYRRKYLGMSAIGEPCERKLWLSFRWAARETFDAPTLKRFEDGHRTEDLIIARLRLVDGLEIHDREEGGGQIACSDFGGHLRGHLDWMCRGLIQAPKAWHVGEMKCSAKINELGKHKSLLGEKSALQAWNIVYYGQAQMYMMYQNVDRHWLVCTTPGGREWTSVRTEYDPVAAMKLKAKAERIIFTEEAPARIGDATNFACRWCHFAPICHEKVLPDRACRNCINAEVLREGGWRCAAGNAFGTACEAHRWLPSMLNAVQVDVVNGSDIVYQWRVDGEGFVDDGTGT